MKQLDQQSLIDLIARQDEAALGELYDRYHRLVFSVALNIVGRREEAEEITLDVFTRVWEKAHTYRSERAKVTTWLTRMTRNRSIDLLRREGVRPDKSSVAWAQVPPETMAGDSNLEAAVHVSLEMQRVRQAMATLPDEQKEVLALAYFKGYSHSEIAKVLDLPLGTVKGRIRSGMHKLRSLLDDE